MIHDFPFYKKAASILMVGVAFFLLSCQVKTVREKAPEVVPEKDLYTLAEEDFQAGRVEEAVRKYRMYADQNPGEERSRTALHKIAGIYLDDRLYDRARTVLERMAHEYPDHRETPAVKYHIARTHYLSGNFEASGSACLEWLEEYPQEPMKTDVMFLLGRSYAELGNRPRAFLWWLRTEESGGQDQQAGIIRLIGSAGMDELREMAEFGADSRYLPRIYSRMTAISLLEDRLDEAKRYAMLLVRSSPEDRWVSLGRYFLEKAMKRMEEKAEIRRGAIGCLLPLTGPYALYGEEVLNGIQLGMDLFRQSTGDQEIELIIRDTRGRAEDTMAHVEELTRKEKVMAIIGPLASGPSAAAVKKAQELGVPIITFTQKEGITKTGDMVFRNFLTPSKEVEALLYRSMNEMGMKRFAIFYPHNAYGTYFMNIFWDKVEEMGGEITAVESYPEDETNFDVGIKKMVGLYYPRPESVVRMLEEMKKAEEVAKDEVAAPDEDMDPVAEGEVEAEQDEEEEPEPIVDFDAVFIPDNHQHIALIAPQFPFYNVFNIPFLGTSLWLSDELIDTTGDYIQGAIFPTGFYVDNDAADVKAFVRDYKNNFESEPGVLAANGYDTIRLLKELFHRGSIKSRKDIQRMLLHYDLFDGVTGRISFNFQGEAEKRPLLLTVYGKRLYVLK